MATVHMLFLAAYVRGASASSSDSSWVSVFSAAEGHACQRMMLCAVREQLQPVRFNVQINATYLGNLTYQHYPQGMEYAITNTTDGATATQQLPLEMPLTPSSSSFSSSSTPSSSSSSSSSCAPNFTCFHLGITTAKRGRHVIEILYEGAPIPSSPFGLEIVSRSCPQTHDIFEANDAGECVNTPLSQYLLFYVVFGIMPLMLVVFYFVLKRKGHEFASVFTEMMKTSSILVIRMLLNLCDFMSDVLGYLYVLRNPDLKEYRIPYSVFILLGALCSIIEVWLCVMGLRSILWKRKGRHEANALCLSEGVRKQRVTIFLQRGGVEKVGRTKEAIEMQITMARQSVFMSIVSMGTRLLEDVPFLAINITIMAQHNTMTIFLVFSVILSSILLGTTAATVWELWRGIELLQRLAELQILLGTGQLDHTDGKTLSRRKSMRRGSKRLSAYFRSPSSPYGNLRQLSLPSSREAMTATHCLHDKARLAHSSPRNHLRVEVPTSRDDRDGRMKGGDGTGGGVGRGCSMGEDKSSNGPNLTITHSPSNGSIKSLSPTPRSSRLILRGGVGMGSRSPRYRRPSPSNRMRFQFGASVAGSSNGAVDQGELDIKPLKRSSHGAIA
eukprot:CAMPEP_0167824530 /NCGR_PEP_ID=MMETSP0112_2-20121227/8841_1 /TAXON_ID=91324 /ORGANISM="Lotharella globosa, Strain CCCM811" /LENGTH=613 /DNA_ID=CAMNT_0007726495 /DNA_START=210 /DNA_END=2051 /DNA_ORIENTATION=+